MREFEQETLSALLDGEADELELRRLLKAMETDSELAQRWERYHLAQSVLHDRGIKVSESLVLDVTSALQDEPVPGQPSSSDRSWQQQLSKVAIAACVAVVAVVVLQPDSPETGPSLVQESSSIQDQSPAEALIAEVTTAAELDPAAQQRLREYIEAMSFDPEDPVRVEHIEDSPLYRLVNEYQPQP